MTAPDVSRPALRSRTGPVPDSLRLAVAVVVGLVFGLLTFLAQSSLPAWIDSISNSASGWSLVAVVAVWVLTDDWRRGAVVAPVVLVALNVGYLVGAELDGLDYALGIWTGVGIVAGPFIGAAAALLHRRDRWAGLAHALLGGLLVAEGITAYATVLGSTSWVYWTIVLVVGLAVVARGVRRAVDRTERGIVVVGAVAVVALTLLAGLVLEQLFHVV